MNWRNHPHLATPQKLCTMVPVAAAALVAVSGPHQQSAVKQLVQELEFAHDGFVRAEHRFGSDGFENWELDREKSTPEGLAIFDALDETTQAWIVDEAQEIYIEARSDV